MRKLSLMLGLTVALVGNAAHAIPIANGDLVVILQKAGTEVIVNIGNALTSHTVDLSGASATLGGLEGAKVAAIGVAEPGRTAPDFGFGEGFLQENILFSTLADASVLTDGQIELAMNATDTAASSTAWFWLLRSVGSNVIQTSQSFSYQNALGLGTDALANNFPFSIASVIAGGAVQLEILNAVRGYAEFGGPATLVQGIGTLSIAGNALSYSAVPEPGTLLLVTVGLAGLATIDRRARRT